MANKPLTQAEKVEAFKRRLLERRPREPWFVTASRLDEALTGPEAVGYGEDVLKKLAADATGLSWGVITRYLSTMRRLKAAAAAAGVAPASLLSPGFNAVEAAVRLHAHSPQQGIAALKALHQGRSSLPEIRRSLADAAEAESGRAAVARGNALRRRGQELQKVEDALAGAVGTLFPKDSTVLRRPALRYFRRVGMEVRRADGRCVCGLDLMASDSGGALDEVEQAVAPALVLSTYFPKFYFVFSPGSAEAAVDEAVSALELLGARWFGVMKVGNDLSIEVLRRPAGAPVPDRSDAYESLRATLARGRQTE
jgi:hypothetical protein